MKKRFVCAMLALVLLVGLVPVTAAAAENKISEAAITVLKQLTTFKDTCYYVTGSEFRTGYGTVCNEKHHFDTKGRPKTTADNEHKITEKQADTQLRTYLAELDKKVNSFASSNGITLSQNQHDALVIYSHGVGTAWLNGTGALKSAILSKAGTNELLNVLKNQDTNAFYYQNEYEVVVNMYVNGVYSNTIPANYKTVTYDANGGQIAKGDGKVYAMRYDSSKEVDHIKATNGNKIFLGWYTMGDEWMPKLNKDCAGKILYAHWQDGYSASTVPPADYTVTEKELASKTVYMEPDTKATTLSTKASGTIQIDNDFIDKSGNRWGYSVALGGWVRIGTPKADAVGNNVIATATVTYNGYLNVRDGAGTDNKIVGALSKNDTVNLYEIKTVNGHRWGKCDAGWICLTYTDVTMVSGKTVSDDGVASYAFTGSVTADVDVYAAAGDASAKVTYEDAAGYPRNYIPKGTENIKFTTMVVASYVGDKATWAKVSWSNPELDKNGKEIKVTRSGWIPISLADNPLGDSKNFNVVLDPVEYTVVAETTNARQAAGDAAALAFTLNKGVRVEVSLVCLMNENIWGKMTVIDAVNAGSVGTQTGWINLASKYVKRSSEIKLDEEEKKEDDHDTGLIATVIDTDSVRVRKTGSLYGAVTGSLSRGTTVRVWESKKDEWYKLDTNQNGVYDYEKDGWVSAKYLNVRVGTIEEANKVTDGSGNTVTTDGTGTGIVANTYSGVNVRQGAGINYAAVGKLLPGTQVEILEVKNGGAAKWGRTDKGWVCMDYISMVKYNAVTPEANPNPTPEKGTPVDSFDNIEKTTTTAVYTGHVKSTSCIVFKEPVEIDSAENYEKYTQNIVRNLSFGDNVTIHELAAVTQKVKSDEDTLGDSNTVTTVTTTTYWARINDGWIQNPEQNLELTALDEKVHTLTGADTLKVRKEATQNSDKVCELEKGDQVKVTALEIEKDKVWGRIETEDGTGWIRLDYMTEGAYYVNKPAETEPTTPAPTEPVMGSTGNTGTGGFVTNSSGYKYTGKVIRANEVNVRASASTSAKKTTTLKNGASLVIYETTISENMAWGRCDAGWIYLYYVDLTPCVSGAVDARVVYNDNTVAYSDVNCTTATGTYARMSVVDIYEIVGKMAKTDLGWVNTDNLL